MSEATAAEVADSMAESIRKDCEAGTPFGVAEEGYYGDHEEGDELTAWDYLEDALDIQYIVNGDRTYRAARVLVGFGGPNVWINTQTGNVEVAWWSALEYRSLPYEFTDALDGALSELWEMGA